MRWCGVWKILQHFSPRINELANRGIAGPVRWIAAADRHTGRRTFCHWVPDFFVRTNLLSDAILRLRFIAENAADADLRFFASRLNEEIRLTLQFKSGGMYTEAKYTVGFVKVHAQEFASDTRLDGETSMALGTVVKLADEVLTLPDTARTADRSAAISQRKDHLRSLPGPYSERYPVGSPVKDRATGRARRVYENLQVPSRARPGAATICRNVNHSASGWLLPRRRRGLYA